MSFFISTEIVVNVFVSIGIRTLVMITPPIVCSLSLCNLVIIDAIFFVAPRVIAVPFKACPRFPSRAVIAENIGSIAGRVSPDIAVTGLLLGGESTSVDATTVQGLMDQFDRIYSSVNAPVDASAVTDGRDMQLPSLDTSSGSFFPLPALLVYQVLDWLRDLQDLGRLAQTCCSFRAVAGHESLCIPAAENNHSVDWGAALDRIDRRPTSHVRSSDNDAPAISADRVLHMASHRWLSILSTEMTSETRESESITVTVRDQTSEVTFFTLRMVTIMSKIFRTYAQRKGVAQNSLRWLCDGDRVVYPNDTAISLQLDNIDCELDVHHEMMGD